MIRLGAFDRHLEPLAWWEVELLPAGWYVDELLVEPAAGGVTGTLTSTLSDATLSATGTVVTPSTSSAILISGSNNPSYRSGFYSPRRGGTPKYPSLWEGCVGAWAPSLGQTGSRLFDQSTYGSHGTLQNMDPATDWVVSGGKGALDFNGTDDYVEMPLQKTNGLNFLSVSCWVNFDSVANNATGGRILGKWFGANLSWLVAQKDNNGQRFLFAAQNPSGFTVYEATSNVLSTGQWYHLACTFKNASVRLFRDGPEIASTAVLTAATTIGDYSSNARFGSQGSGDPSFLGLLDDVRIYNRILSDGEIRTLALRRGIAFERANRKLSVSTAAAPTGSLSSTLANATLSSSGTLASGLTGTLSVTLADATLSATGTVAAGASGTVTRTLDAATLSSSGTIGSGLTGSVSASLGAATLSSSGTLTAGASGSVTRTLDNATLSSSGTVAAGASGTVSRTLDNVTLSSSGGAAGSVTGSVSSTLAAATLSSSGTLAAGLSGSVTRTLDAVTVSASGTLAAGASGTVTRTLANATLASGGSLSAGLTAQVNRALDSCVVSSSGTLASGLTGTLSVQLASATLQSGNVAVGGLRIKVGGEWKNANAFVKVTGIWKNATPFVKVSGVWK
jgi:hypothetical protein